MVSFGFVNIALAHESYHVKADQEQDELIKDL